MTFTSLHFAFFLPLCYLVFSFSSDRWRWLVLLVASYLFYASFNAPYLPAVLVAVTCISYACGLRIAAHHEEADRKRWLQLGVIGCVAVLALLKYLPALASASTFLPGLGATSSVTLVTIGVSYFCFQAISYLADVYLEVEEPEHHFGYFALYLAFFPKLLQGPIERAGDLLPQLKRPYQFDYHAVRSGMLLFTWGLFKKVVVADRFALYADQVYNHVHDYTGLPLLLATYAYAFQIFFDFSAYTDMARGVGRMFGITLTENFNSPYLATSIADFWRRWHISFSRWILNYIFKPLQMEWRSLGKAGTALALLVTFLVSGLWHGATWGFVVWGGLHGLYLAASVYYQPYQKRLHRWLRLDTSIWWRCCRILATFHLVCFAWIFFRAKTLGDAFHVVSNLGWSGELLILEKGFFEAAVLMVALLVLAIIRVSGQPSDMVESFLRKPYWIRWSGYVMLLVCLFLFKREGAPAFVYFQF